MRKIKALIFSGLVFSVAAHAVPVNQADLSAKCAVVASSALTLSAVTQSTTTQDSNNILSAFYLFSMFSGRRLGEEEFLKRYKFHEESLVRQWKSDIVNNGAFRATLEFDRRLIGLMKPCSVISKNFDSSQSSELKAIKNFVETDEGKHLAETLKAMLEPKSKPANVTKPSDDEASSVLPSDSVPMEKRSDIGRVMSQARGRLQSVYKRALSENPTIQGGITIQLDISAGGRVTSVSVVASDLNNKELEEKMLSIIRGMQFDEGNYEPWSGNYKFNFTSY